MLYLHYNHDRKASSGEVTIDRDTGHFTYTRTNGSGMTEDTFSYNFMDEEGNYGESKWVTVNLE